VLGQKPGLVVRAEEVMGSNPALYWMDESKGSYYISNVKKKNKGSQMGHTKRNI